jgi:integrase
MELTIVTGQRREDIAGLKFTDYRDGFLHVIQGKTGAKIRISGALRLEAVGLTLDEVIKRCRDNVVSPYLVHHHRAAGMAKAGQPIMLDTLSSAFSGARDEAQKRGHIEPGSRPPTFHEQRSLAARLYDAEGKDPQALLGHRHATMTEVYKDSRGSEWVSVM